MPLTSLRCSGSKSIERTGRPAASTFWHCSSTASRATASLSLPRASFCALWIESSTDWRSASSSSVSIVPISRTGSTLPSTWVTSSFAKQRTTCRIASTVRMWDRNLLPSPCPSLAPFTSPAMSTSFSADETIFSVSMNRLMVFRRSSGTGTMPTLGSIVQNG